MMSPRIAASVASLSWPAAPADRWYCVSIRPGMRFIAIDALVRQGYPTLMPMIERELRDGGRTLSQMFPGYLFVRFDRDGERWRPIASTIGVMRLFGSSPERPTPIPFGIVENMARIAGPDGQVIIQLPDIFRMGQRLRLTNGPFADLIGVCRLSDGDRIRLLVEAMGHAIEVDVARSMVEKV